MTPRQNSMALSGDEGSWQAHVHREEGQGHHFMVARAPSLGKSYAKNLDDVMLSTRREHLLSTPPRHTTQCVLPLMQRYMMCPDQEHQSPQLTTYIIAVVSRTPPANHLQWCLRGTIMGTWRLVEGFATCVRPLCGITVVFVDMWLDSVVKGVAPSNATTRDHHLLLDKTAGAVVCVQCGTHPACYARFVAVGCVQRISWHQLHAADSDPFERQAGCCVNSADLLRDRP
ncbi:hypothetical protein HPB51_013134 [Rhipicephalus microplus]|uniref:Uncharacterized protein n=1 Tax=Rhipicephalus microplus TaxID=6941 RepID=A0A9J6EGV7_RHIMP|nr:hypothetical protein HPB51_013134 [Rhipicephalus microplus]